MFLHGTRCVYSNFGVVLTNETDKAASQTRTGRMKTNIDSTTKYVLDIGYKVKTIRRLVMNEKVWKRKLVYEVLQFEVM